MAKSKAKSNYNEIDDIREDLSSLKENTIELTKHVHKDAKNQVGEMQSMAEDSIDNMAKAGKQRYKGLMRHVKDNPERSVALAFAGGLLVSYLMARK